MNKRLPARIACIFFIAAYVVLSPFFREVNAGEKNSPPESAGTWTGENFVSDLPLVVIAPGGNVAGTVAIRIIHNEAGPNRPEDVPETEFLAVLPDTLRELPYDRKIDGTFLAVTETGASKTVQPFGLPENDAWTLVGKVSDKGMLRNYLARKLGGELMRDGAPEARYCEVLLADGHRYRYMGLHLFSECVVDGVWMTPQALRNKRSLARYSGGGILSPYMQANFTQIYPPTGSKEDVPGVLSRMTIAFQSIAPAEYLRYMTDLEVDSFIDTFILVLAFMNNTRDVPYSWYFRKNTVGIAPLWDFSHALGNASDMTEAGVEWSDRLPWFTDLVRNGDFIDRLRTRYFRLARGPLAPGRLDELVETLVGDLTPALERDGQRWEQEYASAAHGDFADDDTKRIVGLEQETLMLKHYLRMQGDVLRHNFLRLHVRDDLINNNMDTHRNSILAGVIVALFLLLTWYGHRKF